MNTAYGEEKQLIYIHEPRNTNLLQSDLNEMSLNESKICVDFFNSNNLRSKMMILHNSSDIICGHSSNKHWNLDYEIKQFKERYQFKECSKGLVCIKLIHFGSMDIVLLYAGYNSNPRKTRAINLYH